MPEEHSYSYSYSIRYERIESKSRSNRVTPELLLGQDVDESDLGKGHQGDANPSEGLSKPQASVCGGAEAELELDRTDLKDVAIAQHGFLNRLAIYGSQALCGGGEHRPPAIPQFQARMPVPNAVLLDAKVILGGAPDGDR